MPNQAVYSATKVGRCAPSTEGLRQEAGDRLRVTLITPGFVRTGFVEGIGDAGLRDSLVEARDRMAMAPEAVARANAPSRSSSRRTSTSARSWCVRPRRAEVERL